MSPKKSPTEDLTGKTILITGASAGIGKAAAKALALKNARILMACRNETKARAVMDEIIASTGNSKILIYVLDLSSMESVRRCAEEINAKEIRLDVLINNGGIASKSKKILTTDGFEMTMATNYFGHFLLTNLLLELLERSAPSRIVNVSSSLHATSPKIDVNDLNFRKMNYSELKAYSQSKLCNMLFSLELSRRLQGTGVTSNSLHPGVVKTEIFEKAETFSGRVMSYAANIFAKSEKKGSLTTVHLASSDKVDVVTGKYFVNCKKARSSSQSKNKQLALSLWEATVKLVQLQDVEN